MRIDHTTVQPATMAVAPPTPLQEFLDSIGCGGLAQALVANGYSGAEALLSSDDGELEFIREILREFPGVVDADVLRLIRALKERRLG